MTELLRILDSFLSLCIFSTWPRTGIQSIFVACLIGSTAELNENTLLRDSEVLRLPGSHLGYLCKTFLHPWGSWVQTGQLWAKLSMDQVHPRALQYLFSPLTLSIPMMPPDFLRLSTSPCTDVCTTSHVTKCHPSWIRSKLTYFLTGLTDYSLRVYWIPNVLHKLLHHTSSYLAATTIL